MRHGIDTVEQTPDRGGVNKNDATIGRLGIHSRPWQVTCCSVGALRQVHYAVHAAACGAGVLAGVQGAAPRQSEDEARAAAL